MTWAGSSGSFSYKGLIAGIAFGALSILVRSAVGSIFNRLVVAIILLLLGILALYDRKALAARYHAGRESEAGKMDMRIWRDFFAFRATILYVYGSALGWFFIGLGTTVLVDAAIDSW